MTKNDLNMISGTEKSFSSAKEAIGVIQTAFLTIYKMAEGNDTRSLANEALHEAQLAENHLLNAEKIINGKAEEPTMLELFLKAMEAMHDLEEYVRDEYSSTEDESMIGELAIAKGLISDASAILERAKLRAEGLLKGKTTRVLLQALGEYFTVDHTTPELRYSGIPEEYQK